jgi:hypothetical protein
MKPTILALLGAAALLSPHVLGAQAPPSAELIRDVAASPFTLVARADGSVVGWGYDPSGLGHKTAPAVIDLPGKALRVAVGGDTSTAYVLLEDGTVWAWGTRDDGALGGGDAKPAGSLRVVSALAPVAVPGLEGITQITVAPGTTSR